MEKIFVIVKTNSSQIKVEKIQEDKYIVYLTAQPVDGKANEQLLKVLAKHLQLPKSLLAIKSGKTSKNKVILITG